MAEKTPPKDESLDEESFAYETEYDFEEWDEIPPEEASRLLKGLEGLIPDVVKRTMSHLLASDEGLRALVSEKNLPKELVGYLLGQVDATRRGILRIVSKETRVFLENVDFGGEIAKILTTLSFEVRTEIRFIPNEERVVPNIKNTVRVKRDGEEKSEAAEPPEDEPASQNAEEKEAKPTRPTKDSQKKSGRWTRRRGSDGE